MKVAATASLQLWISWIFTIYLNLCVAFPQSSSPKPTTMTSDRAKCEDKYYYYDHGTDKCEFCCDICCNAEIKDTTEQCETECQEYAQKLKEEAAQNRQNDAQQLQSSQDPEGSGWTDLPLLARIAVIASIVGVLSLLSGLIIAKRKAIVGKFRRPVPDQASIPLQPPAAGHQQDEPDESTRNLLSTTSTGPAIQEWGEASGGEGNSWRIPTHQQTAKPSSLEPVVWKYPILVSQQGHDELVFPFSRRDDHTEPKTVHTCL